MTDEEIKKACLRFRNSIEKARDDRGFNCDFSFAHFPRGCCGDASYLLAEYLRSDGVETIWYSSMRGDWSHAWLVVNDSRVKKPKQRSISLPAELKNIVYDYGAEDIDKSVVIMNYEQADLKNGLIIDITGDQFEDYDIPAYVGKIDDFHRSFEFRSAHDYDGLNDGRLIGLYQKIKEYL